MAYHGGYAGGYADALAPQPVEEGSAGNWRQRPTAREIQRTGRIRYRLTITGSGTIAHPQPATIGAALGGERTHHRVDTVHLAHHIHSAGQYDHHNSIAWRARTGGTGDIPDPDEWVVFL